MAPLLDGDARQRTYAGQQLTRAEKAKEVAGYRRFAGWSPTVGGKKLCTCRRRVEPGVSAAVDLDEGDFGAVGTSGGSERVHRARDILDRRAWTVVEITPPLRHRRW